VADAYIDQYNSNSNFGGYPSLRVGFSSAVDLFHNRALVRFDLSSLPADATIRSAYLEAYLTRGSGSLTQASMGAYFVTSAWSESSVTWNTMPSFDPVGIAGSVDASPGYKSWNVTSFAQTWQSDPTSNHGLQLIGPQTNWWSREFSSREGQYCPRLVLTIESTVPILTPTPTPTSTVTSTPTQPPPPVTRQVQVLGVEVNQAIQTIDINNAGAVPLIAGKTTGVRVHLRVVDGQGDIIGVHGYLHYPYPGGAVYNPVNFGGTTMARANPSRALVDDSLNFVIPGQAAQGSQFMFVRILPPTGVSFSGIGELQETRLLNFQQTPPLRVVFVPITYTLNSTIRLPRAGAINDIRSWLERAYPVPNVTSIQHATTLAFAGQPTDLCGGSGWATLDNQLATLRSTSNTTLGANTLYYGLVPDDYAWSCPGGSFTSGRANGIPSGEAAGIVEAGADDTGQMAGHELGHCLDRYHVEFCNAQAGKPYPYPNGRISPASNSLFGFDIQSFNVYPPTRQDMMTYCWNNMWISDFTYNGLRSRIVQFPLTAAGAAAPQDLLLVSGLINKTTGRAVLDPLYRLYLPAPEPPQSGPCAVVLRSAAGQVLAQHSFTPRVDTQPMEGQDEILTIHELVPDHSSLAQVEVQCEGEVLAAREASAHPPEVNVVAPNGGEMWESDSQTIEWEAGDADDDELHFLVQVSADDGATWTTLASDLTVTSLSFDTALLAGSDQARVRVVASDGLLTAQDASDDPFTVAPKPPQVAIDWPADGSRVRPGQTLMLSGYAWDPEDGPLPAETLTWESDRDGSLGAGAEVAVSTLSPGRHVITLSATDSDGMESSAGVNVFVGQSVYLPLLVRR
jgi:hypothetical protein